MAMGKLGTAIKTGQSAIELGRNVQGLAGAANEFRSADKGELGRKAGRHAFTEGAETGKTMGKTWLKTFEVVPRLVCRGLQFLLALVACGFHSSHSHSAEWVLAMIVVAASATTAIFFLAATPLGAIPYIGSRLKLFKTYRAFPWDLVLFTIWIITFGIFECIYLKRRHDDDEANDKHLHMMKVAIWVDFVNSILWLVSGVYGATKTFLGEKADQLTDKMGQKLFEKKGGAKEATYAESV
ncbi:Fc.00g026470.m01.CDS01 [Cosmosporella sp. VM-42]